MALRAVGLNTHIWNNRLKSALLLAGFPFLLLLMLWAFFAGSAAMQPVPADPLRAGWQGVLSYGHWAFAAAALWFSIAWFAHQRMIEAATGARHVTRKEEPELYNLLENLCISRGLAMPKLAVVESDALNAFASGIGDKTYTVTLTRGLVNALDRDELETVIAHELTHIVNRDVRLLIIGVIFVGMISFASEMAFRVMIRGGRHGGFSGGGRRGRGGGALMLLAFAVLAVGYLFAVVIRFALSRKREYLADAGAVELTRNPDALISALRKISGHAEMPGVPGEVRQMFIENPPPLFGLFATHPPIERRIEALTLMGGRDYTPLNPPGEGGTDIWDKGPWERRSDDVGPWG